MQQALQAGRADVVDATTEADPELVVVFDLADTVAAFARAAARVPGLEFLLEIDGDEFESDDDFHAIRAGERSDDAVTDSLYVVMSNAQAVTELLSLFERWQQDRAGKMPTGLAPLRNVFELLREIRRWGPQDRIRETGLLEQWREDVATVGQSASAARVEIELWYRQDPQRRTEAEQTVRAIVTEAGGEVITEAALDGIAYHAILADIPYSQVEVVVERGPEAIALLMTDTIMYVSPARPMSVPGVSASDDALDPDLFTATPTSDVPRVALLDGLPMAGHIALNGRLVIDDPDQVADSYTSAQMQHGTAMASLISHGDLNAIGTSSARRVYVRPIMQPHPFGLDEEVVLRDRLLVDLVHQAFRRMFEGDGSGQPQAPSVRVVNLSIGDPVQMFVRRISPLAKLLDWLAHRYNVLILVSAGNHSIEVEVPAVCLADPAALRSAVATGIYERARHRRVLSPAEAVNVISVGALHADAATAPTSDTVLDAAEAGMPALYSPVGFGHRNSVKPEVLLPGGRSLHQRPVAAEGATTLYPAETTVTGPGTRVAAPGPGGAINATAYTHGTSNATALATRAVDGIFDVLESLEPQPGEPPFPAAEYHPVLAKTLLVHAASWGPMRDGLEQVIAGMDLSRRGVSRLLGYGAVEGDRIVSAASHKVLIVGAGSISAGQRQAFFFPLPPSLVATTDWRRLTITLSWLSQVNTRTRQHRMARLSFDPPGDALGIERTEAEYWAARKGTVQHEILEGDRAVAFAAGDALEINVDCRVDAGSLSVPVRYGLAATLEVGATVRADIQAEVRQQLQIRLRARAR
ncbi:MULTISPECIES: S8 family peptidase [Mycobacterium simiae complex]|uniref:S8 family peptidase n=1 Tax=Mycobacterium lentiflavum TaxID=141349 RepID=A0ABY3V0U2_MYCLN|nr:MULTISPECIES: S8 family peptidase [Mycobacterium simiae complex]ULP45438.1 S8 family peptidase [Mycobacterium lentiflavum]